MTRFQAENYTDDDEPGLPGSSAELLVSLIRQRGLAEDRKEAKRIAAALPSEEVETFLRSFSVQELLKPFVEVAGDSVFPIYMSPNVIRDGHVIPTAPPLELFATPDGYNEIAGMELFDDVAWAGPSFANGHIYARSDKELICASLMAK